MKALRRAFLATVIFEAIITFIAYQYMNVGMTCFCCVCPAFILLFILGKITFAGDDS